MFTFSLANLQHSLFIAIGLCLFMLTCHILVNNQEAKEIFEANAARKAEIDSLRAENHKILNDGKVYKSTLSHVGLIRHSGLRSWDSTKYKKGRPLESRPAGCRFNSLRRRKQRNAISIQSHRRSEVVRRLFIG